AQAETVQLAGDLVADLADAHEAHRVPAHPVDLAQLRPVVDVPVAFSRGIRQVEEPLVAGQQQRDGVVRNLFGVVRRAVPDLDVPGGRRALVDVVHAHAVRDDAGRMPN